MKGFSINNKEIKKKFINYGYQNSKYFESNKAKSYWSHIINIYLYLYLYNIYFINQTTLSAAQMQRIQMIILENPGNWFWAMSGSHKFSQS